MEKVTPNNACGFARHESWRCLYLYLAMIVFF